jgi:hypothetical protein
MRLALALVLAAWSGSALGDDAQRGALAGRVKDPLDGVVAGAEISVTGPSGVKTTRSDSAGAYTLSGLAPGSYSVLVTMEGFAPQAGGPIAVLPGQTTRLDVTLSLGREEDVTVQSTQPALSLDPSNNAGAVVISGKDLEALPEDPDELADALQALAGPAAGPSGGQIFVDGFTGGRMPPLASIREVRINANPFSAEHDRLGFGRIEILTKPGSDRLRAQTSFRFGDEALNARNPFAPNKPSYQRRQWGGTLGGPLLARRLSFFLDFEQRDVDDNEIVNATVLSPELEPVRFNEAVLARQRRTTVSPRLDWQASPTHTLTARYSYTSSERANAGVGGFALPSRAFGTGGREHTLQLSDTATFGKAVSETRLRFWSERQSREGDDSQPGLQVLDAFSGGGSQVGTSLDEQRRWELHNVTSWTLGSHALRAGFRLRTVRERDDARQGFAGNVTFASGVAPLLDEHGQPVLGDDGQPTLAPLSSLERYRRTLMLQRLGMDPATIRALGGGASQLQISGGDPEASVSQWDWAPFVQDDWRVSPDLLLSAGLRFETQNNIDRGLDLAPRVAFAWSPGVQPDEQARTVVRGGYGIFYERFGQDHTLRARRYDGQHLTEYVVDDAEVLDQFRFETDSVSGVPSVAELDRFALPQATWTVASDLRAPYTAQSSLSVERLLPGNFTVIGSFVASQGRRQLRSRNVNAPRSDGSRPLGEAAGDVYQVESTGRLNQLQWILGLNNRLSPKLTLFLRYTLGRARSDTEGAGSFPADSYDLAGEYGRASTDVRHRVVLGGNVTVPGGIRVSPFLIASTGGPYNITTGKDLNGDGLFTDRPAFAVNPLDPDVVATPYGLLDPTPDPGSPLVARNLGDGPGFFMMNLRLSRTFSLGGQTAAPVPQRVPGGAPGAPGEFGGGRGRMRDGETDRGLTISLSAQNLWNRVNPGAPVGNLGSPFFGRSLSSAGGFGRGGGGSSAGRRIELEVRFSF